MIVREWCRERGAFPLPGGERVRVRGFGPIEGLTPPHPIPIPNGEREQTADAAQQRLTLECEMNQ
jgi:hypothetical protein